MYEKAREGNPIRIFWTFSAPRAVGGKRAARLSRIMIWCHLRFMVTLLVSSYGKFLFFL
jgi:hypothetical protein